jgi:hypothetical protein
MARYIHFDPNFRTVLGWYDTEERQTNLPPQAELIEATDSQWEQRGEARWLSENGKLVKEGPPGPYYKLPNTQWVIDQGAADAAEAEQERYWASGEMTRVGVKIDEYRDAMDLGEAPELSEKEFKALVAYRASLRKWPVLGEQRPTAPDA